MQFVCCHRARIQLIRMKIDYFFLLFVFVFFLHLLFVRARVNSRKFSSAQMCYLDNRAMVSIQCAPLCAPLPLHNTTGKTHDNDQRDRLSDCVSLTHSLARCVCVYVYNANRRPENCAFLRQCNYATSCWRARCTRGYVRGTHARACFTFRLKLRIAKFHLLSRVALNIRMLASERARLILFVWCNGEKSIHMNVRAG